MSLARIAICAAALMTLTAPGAQAAPARVAGVIDLRQGPGSGYPVIAVIPIGSLVDVGGCQGRWCAVAWRGWTGYAVAARFYQGIPGGSPPGLYPPPGWEYPGYGPYYGPGPYAHYWRRRYW
jgi:uncharacterized protein YraI